MRMMKKMIHTFPDFFNVFFMTILLSLSIKSLFSRFKDVSKESTPRGRGFLKLSKFHRGY